jgi:8-oxo-dGTP pyrophosphatase MutT (NUDIX family)
MDIEQIRSALTNKIKPSAFSKLDENKLASVLIIIYGKEPTILMTEKAKTLKVHAGEISFPGGKWCEKDIDLLETALRETEEELDIQISKKQVIGQLEPVITLNSKYMITPFVAILNKIHPLNPNSEVDSVLHIPFVPFLKTMAKDTDPSHRSIKEMYTFTFEEYQVWGASARMLRQIFMLLYKKMYPD